jgi:protease-4
MGADAIYAEPGTITGSIGVVGGKLALKGLFEKLGMTTSVISRGKHSGTLSALEGFSDSERQALQKLLDEIYAQFTQKAAAGRKMKVEDLEQLARGRVYTGTMAKKIGLVDELGTLEDAVARAKRIAKIEGQDVERLVLPKPKSPFEALFGPLDETEARAPAAAPGVLARKGLLEEIGELSPELARQLGALRAIEMLSRESRLTLMPFQVEVR